MNHNILNTALQQAPIGYAYHRILLDSKGFPVDYEFIEINPAYEELTGLNRQDIIGKKASECITVSKHDEITHLSIFGDVAINGATREFEQYFQAKGQWYNVKAISPQKHHFITYLTGIPVEMQLISTAEKLLEYSAEDIDYHKITSTLLNMSGAEYGAFNLFDQETRQFNTVAFAGNTKDIEKAEKLLGFGFEGKKWNIYPDGERELGKNVITRFTHLHEFIETVTPSKDKKKTKNDIKTVERELNIGEVIAVKIIKDEYIIGNYILLMPPGKELMNTELVKLYARQTGLLLTHKRDEDLIKESRHQYKVLFENNLTGILVIDETTNKIVLANDTLVNLFDIRSKEEALELNPFDFIHPHDIDKIFRVLKEDVFEKDMRKSEEFRAITKNGRQIWLRVVGTRIKYDGKTAGLISLYDITEQKLAEEELYNKNELLTLLNNYSMELTSVTITVDIFPIIARKIKELTNAIGVIISHFDNNTHELVIRHTILSDKTNNKLKNIIGREVKGVRVKLKEKDYNQIINEKITYKNSLTEITFGAVPPTISKIIKKASKYRWFVGMGLFYKNTLVGTIIIAGGKDSKKLENEYLNTYAGITANALQRWFAEKSLMESEKKYRFITENTVDVIWMVDFNGNYTFVSPSIEKMLGYTVDEIMKLSIHELIAPDSIDNFHKSLGNELELEKKGKNKFDSIKTIQFEAFKKDGSKKWMESTVSFYRDSNLEPTGFLGVSRDITERKKAEDELKRSESQFKMLLEELPDYVMVHQKGEIVYANKATINAIGLSKENFLGTNILEYVADKDKATILNNMQRRSKGEVIEDFEVTINLLSGETKDVIIRTSDIIFEGEPSVIIIIIDITEQKKTQKLQHEISVARQSAQFKQNFLANMSHEIRTPLTGIMGMSDLLLRTQLDDIQQDYLNTIKHSTENLKEIIDLILDYSKIEAGKAQLKTKNFAVRSLSANAEKIFYSICKKNIEFDTYISPNVPEYINTDQHRLNQIINNLLSNAVKNTQEGKISINTYLESTQDTTTSINDLIVLRIEVIDTGRGIKPVMRKILFKPFTQIEQEDIRHYEGTGLGLAICKELSSLLGGEIDVDSKPGKGSKFWFTFQARIVESEYNHKDQEATYNKNRSLNILFVEDKKVTQKVVSLMLESQGHKVIIAENGLEALQVYETKDFDLILMDIQMPVMDGITATKNLRKKHDKLPPIIGLSANAFEGDREKYMQQGLDDYLTKPLKIEDLNSLMHEFKLI